jgi:hypothetical protein
MPHRADEATVKRMLVSAAKQGITKKQASAAIKGIMASSYVYVGKTPIEKVISDNWERAKATAEVRLASDLRETKRQWRRRDFF